MCEGSFVGINKHASSNSSVLAVHFYLLVREEEFNEKSVEEIVINTLNAKIIEISAGTISENLFEKKDLGSVGAINFNLPNRKLLSVNITIPSAVLSHSVSLISAVQTLYEGIEGPTIPDVLPHVP